MAVSSGDVICEFGLLLDDDGAVVEPPNARPASARRDGAAKIEWDLHVAAAEAAHSLDRRRGETTAVGPAIEARRVRVWVPNMDDSPDWLHQSGAPLGSMCFRKIAPGRERCFR
jgi:hypothetical protein